MSNQKPETETWIEERNGKVEVNPMGQDVTVNVGTNQRVTIDKLYGPLCASEVRVHLEHTNDKADWVVEHYNLKEERWEEKARWDCQESWPEPDS
jgi:hypothetical protein